MRLPVNHAVPLALIAALAACSGGPKAGPLPVQAANGPAADYPMVIGSPFTVGTISYTPVDKLNYDTVGYAATGGAGGEGVSAAHKTLPLPSYAEVTSLASGKTILVRVERRGPMDNDTLVELSPGAAAQLGVAGNPKAPVRLRRVNPPEAERAVLRSGQRAPERMETPKGLLEVLVRKLGPGAPALAAKPEEDKPAPAVKPTEATSTPARTPAPRRAARVTAAPAPTPTASPTAKPTPAAAATPAVTPATAAPAPKPAATSTRAAPPSLVIQVAAFSTRERADAAAGKLGAQVVPVGRLWSVRLGPFTQRSEAEPALAKAKTAGYSDARIQRAN